MELEKLITDLDITSVSGSVERTVGKVTFDSRLAEQGDLFVAIRGTSMDGHEYIGQAISNGATVIVCEMFSGVDYQGTVIIVPDSRKALSLLASAFFGYPSRELHLVGITGTNGKTTVASLLYQLHEDLGYKAGLLSTVRVLINGKALPATHTTPDPVSLNAHLRTMADAGCEYCFMEVSSHAISQDRVHGLEFNGGVFTNLTHEHLDYHNDFRDYLLAKKKFFDELHSDAYALANADDKNGKVMLQNCPAEKHTYSLKTMSEFRGQIIEMHMEGTSMRINGNEVWIRLPGRFNASNVTAVYGAAILSGQHPDEVTEAISRIEPVEGRFEAYRTSSGITAIVDYAHTPDALKNVLETIREVNVSGATVITVIGAGGNRDRSKRPRLARIAAELSDRVILTSDNPRFEDPEAILDEMMTGVPDGYSDSVVRIENRREAIRTACILAETGDIILVAGKGHEKYQDIQGDKKPFDDMKILTENLR